MHAIQTDRRTRLREATSDLHHRLDALASRLDLRLRADYCRYLRAKAGPVIGLEVALEQNRVEEVFADWPRRRRRFALALDLHSLGLTAVAVDTRSAWTRSMMLGALYVLEGSRLGAQVLLRRVDQSGDHSVLEARHFLRGNDPTLWVTFLRTLEDTSAPIDVDEMVGAARETFELFYAAFAAYCPPSTSATASSPSLALSLA